MDVVLLAHGWLGSPNQFRRMAAALRNAGYDARAVSYRTVLGTFERAVDAAGAAAAKAPPAQLHLIGFSLGGLVMRALAAQHPPGLASLLLIGTPNHGSKLADIGRRLMPTPALRRLSTRAPPLPPLPAGLRVGCIAGSRSDPLGWLIGEANDGRVAVSSALAVAPAEHWVLPVRHDDLPFAPETARLAIAFLSNLDAARQS